MSLFQRSKSPESSSPAAAPPPASPVDALARALDDAKAELATARAELEAANAAVEAAEHASYPTPTAQYEAIEQAKEKRARAVAAANFYSDAQERAAAAWREGRNAQLLDLEQSTRLNLDAAADALTTAVTACGEHLAPVLASLAEARLARSEVEAEMRQNGLTPEKLKRDSLAAALSSIVTPGTDLLSRLTTAQTLAKWHAAAPAREAETRANNERRERENRDREQMLARLGHFGDEARAAAQQAQLEAVRAFHNHARSGVPLPGPSLELEVMRRNAGLPARER